MATIITEGIKISVKVSYKPEYSDPTRNHFLFSYRVTIENKSEETVQLMRRHWVIFDSLNGYSEVEGEGVVGLQPTLRPGDVHEYESACSLNSQIGKMQGTYTMQRKSDGATFKVKIPVFEMFTNHVLS